MGALSWIESFKGVAVAEDNCVKMEEEIGVALDAAAKDAAAATAKAAAEAATARKEWDSGGNALACTSAGVFVIVIGGVTVWAATAWQR